MVVLYIVYLVCTGIWVDKKNLRLLGTDEFMVLCENGATGADHSDCTKLLRKSIINYQPSVASKTGSVQLQACLERTEALKDQVLRRQFVGWGETQPEALGNLLLAENAVWKFLQMEFDCP